MAYGQQNARATNVIKTMYQPTESTETTQRMSSTDGGEIQLDEDTYKLAEKCAKKLGLTVDEFVSKAIDEKHKKLNTQNNPAHQSLTACMQNHR